MADLLLLLPPAFISFFALLTFLFAITNLASWHRSVKDREWCADGIAYEDTCKLGPKFIAAYILAISGSAALLTITGLNFVNALRLNSTGTCKNNTVAALVSLIVLVVYIAYLALISANGKNDVVSISSWNSGYGSSAVYVGTPGGGLSTSPEDQWSGSTINNGGVVAPGMIAALCTIALALFDSFHSSQDQDDKRSSA